MTYADIYFDRQDPNNEGWAFRRFELDDMGRICDEESGPIDTLDDLSSALIGAKISDRSECQAEDLPTFGGSEPEDTSEVLSWDETRLLVQAADSDPTIVPRTTYAVCDTTNGQLEGASICLSIAMDLETIARDLERKASRLRREAEGGE